jgi:hypothetical protein
MSTSTSSVSMSLFLDALGLFSATNQSLPCRAHRTLLRTCGACPAKHSRPRPG